MPVLPLLVVCNTVYRLERGGDWIEYWVLKDKNGKHNVYCNFTAAKKTCIIGQNLNINDALFRLVSVLQEARSHKYEYIKCTPFKNNALKSKKKKKKIKYNVSTKQKLPDIFYPGTIYHFRNTTTRNAFWEIWAECESTDEGAGFSIKVRYGKIGTLGKDFTKFQNLVEEDVQFALTDCVRNKMNNNYVYVKSYDLTTKGSNKPKQKDPQKIKEPEAMDVLAISKSIHQRVIKIVY